MKYAVSIEAPAHWASALMYPADVALGHIDIQADELAESLQWLADQKLGNPVSVSDQTFTDRWNGLLTEMATYTFLVDEAVRRRAASLAQFIAGYEEALDFTECSPDADPGVAEAAMAPSAHLENARACAAFVDANTALLTDATGRAGYGWVEAGRDLWFTRNGHGVGFWDREVLKPEQIGQRLTDAARAFGPADVYLGDDGLLHIDGESSA